MLVNNFQKTIDAIYPIGALYLSMNNTNPELLFGGKWKQLTADAYLKIVTSGASETAKGNTDHKITVKQMPSHKHNENYGKSAWVDVGGTGSSVSGNMTTYNQTITSKINETSLTGGGQAYYPGYIGIYVWYRTD